LAGQTIAPLRSIRGPLRYEVETSTPQIEAGKQFSVAVKITNPYDVPTSIKSVRTKLPAKFEDIERRITEKRRLQRIFELQELMQSLLEQKGAAVSSETKKQIAVLTYQPKQTLLQYALEAFSAVLVGVKGGTAGTSLYTTASTARTPSNPSEQVSKLSPEDVAEILKDLGKSTDPSTAIEEKVLDSIKKKLELLDKGDDGDSETRLQPGNSSVQVFTFRTTQVLFFTPSSYNLNIQIEYENDGQANQDSVEFKLDVRAPLKALIWGSVIGSVMGYLMHDIFDQKALLSLLQNPNKPSAVAWLISLFGNVLLGVLIVIAFARKKDAQPLLSVEDFWGGIFVGFLAGYSGKNMLSQVIPAAKASS
jgi:hypothetical protein